MAHARLWMLCVHMDMDVHGETTLTGVTLRCERCATHLMLGLDGKLVLDEGCSDGRMHVAPELEFSQQDADVLPLDGGPRGRAHGSDGEDGDTFNTLIGGLKS